MSSVRLLALLGAALLVSAACTGDDDSTATPTSEATPTAEAPASPTSVVTGTSVPVVTPLPGRTGVMLLDVRGVGEYYTLYEGDSHLLLGDPLFPRFAADGSVWLSTGEWTGAVDFSTSDGAQIDEIDGAYGVSTTADGTRRAYYLSDARPTAPDLVIEYDGATEVIAGPIEKHEFSPDGTNVSYYRRDEDGSRTLYVIDLESRATTMLASEIEPCQCDWTSGPVWSPSGNYLGYVDNGRLAPGEEATRGQYVVAATGEEPVDVGSFAGWLPGVDGELAVIERDGEVLLFEAATGELRSLVPSEDRSVSVRIVGDRPVLQVQSTDRSSADTVTSLWDAVSGEELARWEVWGDAMLTPDGPAIVAHQKERAGLPLCNGLAVLHAALAAPACVEHAERGVWSPDGRLLAVHGDSRASIDDWIGVWSPDGGLLLRFDVAPDTVLVEWNADGTHLLVSWRDGV